MNSGLFHTKASLAREDGSTRITKGAMVHNLQSIPGSCGLEDTTVDNDSVDNTWTSRTTSYSSTSARRSMAALDRMLLKSEWTRQILWAQAHYHGDSPTDTGSTLRIYKEFDLGADKEWNVVIPERCVQTSEVNFYDLSANFFRRRKYERVDIDDIRTSVGCRLQGWMDSRVLTRSLEVPATFKIGPSFAPRWASIACSTLNTTATTHAEPLTMSNMLTVQSVSNSELTFYSSSRDQYIHHNFFANTVNSIVDAGESLTWLSACELALFPMSFPSWRLLLVIEKR
jgi:hypothetical protein